jgi:hypothetical protein
MRPSHLGIVLFALGALGTSSAWGSVEPAGKLRPSPAASVLPIVAQRDQLGMLDARVLHQLSEISLVAFADKADKGEDKDKDKEREPPPKHSGKCPPGHGGDDEGHGNDGHDCRVDK